MYTILVVTTAYIGEQLSYFTLCGALVKSLDKIADDLKLRYSWASGGIGRRYLTFSAAMVELVDTSDSKSDACIRRAGSSPARGTKC